MFAYLQNLNQAGLVLLNNLWQYGIVQKIAIIFADAPIFFLPVFLVGFWLFYTINKQAKKKNKLLIIFYSIIFAIVVNMIIQYIVPISRPSTFLWVHAKFLLSHIPDASFPSDHATVSAAFLASILLSGYKKTFWIFLPFALIMLVSRVIAGVHWPFDIVVWIVVWTVAGYVVYKFKSTKAITCLNSGILKIASFIRL